MNWVVTNRIETPQGSLTTDEVQQQNAVRWQIEQMHRELKQLVGTEKCQCCKARSQRNHLACCYHARLTLKINTRKAQKTLYDLHHSLFSEIEQHLVCNLWAHPLDVVDFQFRFGSCSSVKVR